MPETALILLRDMRSFLSEEQDSEFWALKALVSICSTPDIPEITGLQMPLDERAPPGPRIEGYGASLEGAGP
jgi:hypothetical protein